MSFRCDDTLLQMYLDGDMGAMEREIVESHVKVCHGCARQVSLYKGLMWDLEHPVAEAVPPALDAVSDRLMAAWTEAQAPATWQEAAVGWVPNVPGLEVALETGGRVGRSLPRLGLAGLKGLGRRLWRGGGSR